jgi:hypothetical protein
MMDLVPDDAIRIQVLKSRTDSDAILTIFSSVVSCDSWRTWYLVLRIKVTELCKIMTKSRTDSDAILMIFSSSVF